MPSNSSFLSHPYATHTSTPSPKTKIILLPIRCRAPPDKDEGDDERYEWNGDPRDDDDGDEGVADRLPEQLGEFEESHGHHIVHPASVLGETIENTARRVGVEEAYGRVDDALEHRPMKTTARGNAYVDGGHGASQGEHCGGNRGKPEKQCRSHRESE